MITEPIPLVTPVLPPDSESPAYLDAIEVLRNELRKNRKGAWWKVSLLVPDPALRRLIRLHVKDLKLLDRLAGLARPRARPRTRRDSLAEFTNSPNIPRGNCRHCQQPLPHPRGGPRASRAEKDVLARHFRSLWARHEAKSRWKKLAPAARAAATLKARQARRRKTEERWLASLDPRVVKVLGRQEALRHYVRNYNATVRPSKRLKEP